MKSVLPILALILLLLAPKTSVGQPLYQISSGSELQRIVEDLFSRKDFPGLERLRQQILTKEPRYPSGTSKLEGYYDSLAFSCINKEFECSAEFDVWKRSSSSSAVPYTAHARLLYERAWQSRGTAFADKTKTSAFHGFEENLKRAWTQIEQGERLSDSDILLYYLKLSIAHSSGFPRTVTNRIFDEALKKDPFYPEVYEIEANFSLPKWGGRPGDFRAVAERAVSLTESRYGRSFYALVCWAEIRDTREKFFAEKGIPWPKVRASFVDLIKAFPESRRYLARYALAAYYGDDRAIAREVLSKLGGDVDRYVLSVFKDEAQYREIRKWAGPDEQKSNRSQTSALTVFDGINLGNRAMINEALAAGADISALNEKGEDVFEFALRRHYPDLLEFLLNKGAKPVSASRKSKALIYAAHAGLPAECKFLLSAGFDPTTVDMNEITALHYAMQDNEPEIVRTLLESDHVDPNYTPSGVVTPLTLAASLNKLEAARTLLANKRTKVNLTSGEESITALHAAARGGHQQMVALLLKHGADLTVKDSKGDTALAIANKHGQVHLHALLTRSQN